MASAAYRAGEKLHSEYYGEDSDYTNKGGVIYTEIILPSLAPREYADRETLWNAVEKAEKGKKAQLAYSFDISFQNEFSQEENIALARQFLTKHFVSRGMVVDFAVHEPENEEGGINNPHFSQNYEAEQKQLEAEVVTLGQEIEVQERQNENIERFIRTADKYVDIEEIDPCMLRELIKAIYVEAPDKSSGKRRQKIHIEYDGIGFIPLEELAKKETA